MSAAPAPAGRTLLIANPSSDVYGSDLQMLETISPVVAAALGWLVLGQSLTPPQGVGFALALLSIAAAQLSPQTARSLLKAARPGRAKAVDQEDRQPVRLDV